MAHDLNLCQFIGRLGKDPDIRYGGDGAAIANFSIACGWKTGRAEGTEWIRVVIFGKLAEVAGGYLKKGKQVYIAGRFRTREYEKEGQKRYVTEVVADQMQMLGGRDGGDAGGGYDDQPAARPQRPAQQRGAAGGGYSSRRSNPDPQPAGGTNLADMDDDQIPF